MQSLRQAQRVTPSPALLSEVYSYRAIGDRLATASQPTEDQFRAVRSAGFAAVINLALPTSDNALAHEGSIVTGFGMAYVHIPVAFDAPTPEDFRSFCRAMAAFKEKRVFVHCAANKRVSVFVFLYRVLVQRAGMEDAQRDLFAIWQPDSVWRYFIRDQLESGGREMEPSIHQQTRRGSKN